MKKYFSSFSVLFTVFYCFSAYCLGAESGQGNSIIRVVSPGQGTEILTKHLDIQAIFTGLVYRDSLVVILDDTDITAMVSVGDRGLHCRVPMQMSAGKHNLYIAGNSDNGPFEREIEFSSRQYATFDEAATDNEWTLNLKAGNYHTSHGNNFASTDIDSILQHQATVKKGSWQVNVNGTIRLLEQNFHGGSTDSKKNVLVSGDAYGPCEQTSGSRSQNQGSIDPERQGLDLNTVLLKVQYRGGVYTSSFELGDLQIVQSKNTFQSLARNGSQIKFAYRNFHLTAFSVFGRETFGLHNGFGVGFDDDENLYGLCGAIRFLDKKIDLRGFYMVGGRRGNSYSYWSQEEENSGNVFGFLLGTDFFSGLLKSEFEYDCSDFDADSRDGFGKNADEAWRLQVGGQYGIYTYNIVYERFGSDYDIPGNLGPKKDYSGITGTTALQYDVHALSLVFAGYHDNVDGSQMYARTNSYSGNFDYSYTGFREIPLTVGYQHTVDRSSNEPPGGSGKDLSTDTLSLNGSYLGQGPFSLASSTAYSRQNDDSNQDADITTLSFTLSSSLSFETFSVSISGTCNHNRDLFSGINSDDYVLALDTMGSLFNERVSYELGATYDYTSISDNSGDRYGFTGHVRISYHLPRLLDFLNTSLGLEFQYNSDSPGGAVATEDSRLFCTISNVVPLNF